MEHSTGHPSRGLFRPYTYLLIILYIVLFTFIINDLFTDEQLWTLAPSQMVLSNSTTHFTKVKPALARARVLVQASLQPSRPMTGVIIIVGATWFLLRYPLRRILVRVNSTVDVSKPRQRTITIDEQGRSVCTDVSTNFLQTTTFGGPSWWVAFISFFYGALIYLSQRIQVWCISVAIVQVYMFSTGKSFYPLIAFTLFMAYMHSLTELGKWRKDKEKNERPVTLVCSNHHNHTKVARGGLRPGDQVVVRGGEEVPADLIITGVHLEGQPRATRRIQWAMNEVNVTGETAPIRKRVFADPVTSVEILKLDAIEALVNSSTRVTEEFIAFANSKLTPDNSELYITGVVAWVGLETRALNSPITADIRRSSPFSEYSNFGFLISIVAMITLATINAIVAYFYFEGDVPVSFQMVWVNHCVYLNMIVPQAMEQLRLAVCKLLSLQFKSKVGCNNSLVIDTLAYVVRIVTDKTGTVTENKMVAKIQMVYYDNENENETDNYLYEDDQYPEQLQPEHYNNALAIMATSGMEPEEVAIRNKIKDYCAQVEFAPPDPVDVLPGVISYNIEKELHKLTVLVSFGFQRSLLCKPVLFKQESTGDYYVAVQAGGDEFWANGLVAPHPSAPDRLKIWDQVTPSLSRYNGAPRTWSHGLKKISTEEALEIVSEWHITQNIDDKAEKEVAQKRLTIRALNGVKIISKTFMVDAYRKGVSEGIRTLVSSGKQIILCTGDSQPAAETIAHHLKFPICFPVSGEDEMDLLASLRKAEIAGKKHPCTYMFNQKCTERLRDIANERGGFVGEEYDILFRLLHAKDKQFRYLHYAIFCRATPGLKPWVVRLMQHKPPHNWWETVFPGRHYVLACGDGFNDINMLKVADASLGIRSGETEDVINQASLSHTEWEPLVTLLLQDGPSMATMLATMIKLIFLKHWITAIALWADLVFQGFSLLPMDPCNPMMMVFYNSVIFSQIASHSAADVIHNPERIVLDRKNIMSMRAFMRWAIAAVCSGLATTWIVRWLFPAAAPHQFGAMIQVAQACSVTVYLMMSTNVWSEHHNPKPTTTQAHVALTQRAVSPNLYQIYISILSLAVAVVATVLSYHYVDDVMSGVIALIIVAVTGYPALNFASLFLNDIDRMWGAINYLIRLPRDQAVGIFINWSHTKEGRFVPIALFALSIRLITGVSLPALLVTGILSAFVSSLIFIVIVSKLGFLRALFDGKSLAVGLLALVAGFLLGRSTSTGTSPLITTPLL